jgi:hypothetical protein
MCRAFSAVVPASIEECGKCYNATESGRNW